MEARANKKFIVYEWTIYNFSCWNEQIHDTQMECGSNEPWVRLELRRTHVMDDGEHLAMYARYLSRKKCTGDLSFLGPDGSLIWTKQVSSEAGQSVLKVHPGPRFEQIVNHIRSREARHGDHLTLRFRCQRTEKEGLVRLHSQLDIRTVSLKIALASLFHPPVLSPPPLGRLITCLKLPSNDDNEEIVLLKIREDQFSKMNMHLQPALKKDEKIFVRTAMSVLDSDDFVIRTEENEQVIQRTKPWTFSNSIRREELDRKELSILLRLRFVSRNKLKHIYHHSSTYPEFVSEIPTVDSVFSNKPEDTVTVPSQDFMCLHLNQEFSDIQLHCGDVAFPTHKNVLSARSPVLKRMMTSDMKETGSVDIVDLESSTLSRFLAFLYSGRTDDLDWESASKLYYAADKYEVPSLERACADFLCANVSLRNVCDLLALAERHQDDRLTTVAHLFVVNNYSDVLGSEEWGRLMERDPLLTSKTLTLFAQKKYVGSLNVF